MKRFLALVCLLSASAASARPLAYLEQSGGFCMGMCPRVTLSLQDSGEVVVETETENNSTPSMSYKVLLRLDAFGPEMTDIRQDISLISAAPLVDLNQGQPICADAPEIRYFVFNGPYRIQVGLNRDCHRYRMAGNDGIADMLHSFLSIYHQQN